MQSTHGVNFVHCVGVSTQVSDVFIHGHGVCVVCLGPPTKRTEAAGQDADVGLVDVHVGIEKRLEAKSRLSHDVGQGTHFMEVGVMKQDQPVFDA